MAKPKVQEPIPEVPAFDVNGTFRRLYRSGTGMYGIEVITLEHGKVVSLDKEEATFPTVTLHKYGKKSFDEAMKTFEKSVTT